MILSVGGIACATPIQNCQSYSDKKSCLLCLNSKILSINALMCAGPIINCLLYSDDGTCQSCINGTIISSDKLFCNESNVTQNQSFRSQISFRVTNDSLQGKALPKEKSHSITITYQNHSDYTLSLFDDFITLNGSTSNSSIQVLPALANNSIPEV